MKKIPTLFVRPEGNKLVVPEVREGCEWVINGEGVATVKWDGSCCMVRDGKLYARYQAKTAPTPEYAAAIGFIPINDDGQDGHRHGWRLVDNGPADQYHREAWANRTKGAVYDNWTYELVGPKLQGNPHKLNRHELWTHGIEFTGNEYPPHTFEELRAWLIEHYVEGIVWWRDINNLDCDKVKIKRRDFGLPWPVKGQTP